jgi:tetratricopeptide (TPR) repeat protein
MTKAKARSLPVPVAAKPAPSWLVRRRVRPGIKAAVIALCVAVLAVVGYFGVYPQATAYVHWRKADKALAQLDFDTARRDLETCASIWKQSAETQFLLARTCRRAGDLDAATAHLHRAKELHWVDGQLRLEAILVRTQAGAIKSTESVLHGYLDRGDPDSRLILEALVVGSLQANFLKEAYHWASAWCKNFPDDWEGHYWQGNVLLAGLNLDKAAAEYEKALAGNPNFALAHRNLADVLRRRGRFSEAITHFDSALAQRPDDSAALLGRARCHRSLNQPAQARADLDHVLAMQPKDAIALRLRGQLELDRDDAPAALGWLLQADTAAPNDKDTIKALADTYRRLHKLDEMAKYEARWTEIDTGYRRLEEITNEVAKDSQNVTLRYEAATILLHLGHRRKAVPWLTSILQIDPTNEPARQTLVTLLKDLNDPTLSGLIEQLKAGERATAKPES